MEWLSPAVGVLLALFSGLIGLLIYLIKAHWSDWKTRRIAEDSRMRSKVDEQSDEISLLKTTTAVHGEKLKQHDRDIEHLDERINRSQDGG